MGRRDGRRGEKVRWKEGREREGGSLELTHRRGLSVGRRERKEEGNFGGSEVEDMTFPWRLLSHEVIPI